MAIDTATFETTLDSKIDAATTSDDAKSFLLLAKAVEAVNNAISSSSLSKSNNLSDLLNTTTALTNLGFTATIAELNYTDGVTSNIQTQLDAKATVASPTFTGTPAAPTAATGTNTTQIATTAFVQGEVTALVDSAPSTLNTLNELAAALGDDANFSTTVTNSIATKLPLAGGTMTGNIAHASDFTVDAGGNISLDADGGNILIKDGGTHVGSLRNVSSDFVIQSIASDNNIIFKGNDGGSEINALALDMSDAGTAIFYHDVKMGDLSYLLMGDGNDLELSSDGTNGKIAAANGNLLLDVGGNLALDADSGEIQLKDGGVEFGQLAKSGNDFRINQAIQDGDIVFRGNDGGSVITALTLDMSDAGAATFNSTITTTGVDVNGPLQTEEIYEKVNIATATSGTITFVTNEYAVLYYTANQTANRTINFSNVNASLSIGQSLTCAVLLAQGSTAYYLNSFQVDGSSVTPKWQGGSAPSSGNASGIDSYSFTIIKTANATFTVLASQTQYA